MQTNKLAIGSLSLGQHPGHRLDAKIEAAAKNGFSGVEVVYSDLETFSNLQMTSILQGAAEIKNLCDRQGMHILSLAAFENFEGSHLPLEERLERAKHWVDVAAELGATYLQVPAQYDEACRGDTSTVVSDLQKLADLAGSANSAIAIAYEPMSWSVHNSTWEGALDTIKAVDRPNFGLCLDSFHILTKLWANPFEPSGKYPHADEDLVSSLERFKTRFPIDKLFYVQLSDGERFDPPFSKTHPWYLEGEAPQFTWSRHARPFPLEVELGGYMPVAQFLRECVIEKGFTGWVSLEIFDRRMRSQEFEPNTAAIRGKKSWKRLCQQAKTGTSKM